MGYDIWIHLFYCIYLQQYQTDIESHQATKERLNQVVEELLESTRGDTNFLRESQLSLDENWTELWALLEDREEELIRHRADLLVVSLFGELAELDAWFDESLRIAQEPCIEIGNNSMDSAKKRLAKFNVSENHLINKQFHFMYHII